MTRDNIIDFSAPARERAIEEARRALREATADAPVTNVADREIELALVCYFAISGTYLKNH